MSFTKNLDLGRNERLRHLTQQPVVCARSWLNGRPKMGCEQWMAHCDRDMPGTVRKTSIDQCSELERLKILG